MKKIILRAGIISLTFSAALGARDITKYHRDQVGAVTWSRYGIAHIITPDGWVAIDRKRRVKYRPFLYDNGPDYYVEGLMRFIEGDKIGFVNEAGKKVIRAQFDFVYPFEKGKARFCQSCLFIDSGEHSMPDTNTGVWGTVDKKGRITMDKKIAP